jgi:hypothetical protein
MLGLRAAGYALHCRRPILQSLDNIRPLPFDADEENEVGLGQERMEIKAW